MYLTAKSKINTLGVGLMLFLIGGVLGGARVKNGWFVSHRWMTSLIFQYVVFGLGFVVLLITTILFAVLTKSTTNAQGLESCSARTGQ